MRQLVYNAVRCRQCGTVLQSLHRHDYKTCNCENETMADGGLDYIRCGGVEMRFVEPIPVYFDEPFEKVRQYMYRTGHGKTMTDKYQITRLFEMTDEHLDALMTYPCAEWQRMLVVQEMDYRKANNISITDKV